MAASSSSPAHDSGTPFLDFGKQCSDPTCLLIDFLPLKCQHCELWFCQEHFKVAGHRCAKYEESKHNRVAPNCPLCNIPVPARPGQDLNVRMDFHLERECYVVTGRVKAKSIPLCARRNCKKALLSPIRCTSCTLQFCPYHRFPSDHSCSFSAEPAKHTNRPNGNTGAQKFNVKASVAGAALVGAIKQGILKVSTPSSGPGVNAPPSSKRSTIPFSSVSRRARAERKSKRKALQVRAQKGLLTNGDKDIVRVEGTTEQEKAICAIM